MKKPSSVISLLITLMLAAVVCIQGSEPVKDTDGNEVIANEQYFIQPVKTQENNGGGLAPAPTKNFSCPLGIVQSIIPTEPGLPVIFKLVDVSEKTTVETSSPVNIKFEASIWFCGESNRFWEVDDSSTAGKEPLVLTGDNPEEKKSQFKIEKTGNANTYKFTNSDGSVPIRTKPGSLILFGARVLVLTNDDTNTESLIVTFKKVKVDATTATSRVEKLGLRMFPFY